MPKRSVPQGDVFSLIRSELNEFLFAPIGVEQNGMTLSLISGLARLGVDPWAEAARLAKLPSKAAIDALARTIAAFSGGLWKPDAHRIAERLIRLLPQGGVARSPAQAPAPATEGPLQGLQKLKIGLRAPPSWVIWALLAALAVATLADRVVIFGGRQDTPTQSTDERP